MRKLTFRECTLSAGKSCIASVKAAVKRFSDLGKKGFVTLEKITVVESGESQIVWVSRHHGRLQSVLPIFEDEVLADPFSPTKKLTFERVKEGELIHRGDYFYQTYLNDAREMGIRAIVIFHNENFVRRACALMGYNVSNVRLVQMYDAATGEDLTAAWLVECVDKSPLLIYVDLRDENLYGNPDFVYVPLKVGQEFFAYDTQYTLMRSTSQWYLVKGFKPVYSTEPR